MLKERRTPQRFPIICLMKRSIFDGDEGEAGEKNNFD